MTGFIPLTRRFHSSMTQIWRSSTTNSPLERCFFNSSKLNSMGLAEGPLHAKGVRHNFHTASGNKPRNVQQVNTDFDIADTFRNGKFPGTGLPKPVGQPEDLKHIEFGKPTGFYNFVREQHGDPRGHLHSDGRFRESYATDNFHWYDAYTDVPKQQHTLVNGELMIKGVETRPMEELFGLKQTNIPFTPRRRLNLWGNHRIILQAEFCFFWIPTFIIFSLAVPCYTMLYLMDEAVDTSMTVKVIGHQWYWVYEVESPALE